MQVKAPKYKLPHLAQNKAPSGCTSMRHNPAVYDIRVSIIALIAVHPVIDHPLLPSISIALAPIVDRIFQGELHAVSVRGAVAWKIQLVALAVVILEGVGIFSFYAHIQSVRDT